MAGDASCFRGLLQLEPEGDLASVDSFQGDLQSTGTMPLPWFSAPWGQHQGTGPVALLSLQVFKVEVEACTPAVCSVGQGQRTARALVGGEGAWRC